MSEAVDYFANHRHKLKFPWSLYHRPIVSALEAALGSSLGPEVLNVGSGPFFELEEVDLEFTDGGPATLREVVLMPRDQANARMFHRRT